jgi:hypothetical protein
MTTNTATSVEYLGTFTAYTPDPWPEDAPRNALFLANEDGIDLRDKLSWADPEPTGDLYLGVSNDGRVVISSLDVEEGKLPTGLSRRVAFHPEDLKAYRVAGLPNLGIDGAYNRWFFVAATGEITTPEIPPRVVSRFQARRALKDFGLFAQVETMIAASGNDFLQDAWADAQEFREDSNFVQALGAELDLTPEQIGAIFDAAALIVA